MGPDFTLELSVSHAPRYFVRLEVPSLSDVLECLHLLFRNVAGPGFIEVLHRKRTGRVYGRRNEDGAIAVSHYDARVLGGKRYTVGENGLRIQPPGEGERKGRKSVHAGKRGL